MANRKKKIDSKLEKTVTKAVIMSHENETLRNPEVTSAYHMNLISVSDVTHSKNDIKAATKRTFG